MQTSNYKSLKILLSVYACEPGRGSEPGVGWNMAVEIAKKNQVWAFTSNTHRSLIEAELAIRPIPNLNFIYFDPFNWVYDWSQEGKKAQWNIHLHYYLWQIWAYFVAQRLHKKIHFNLVHHVTYVKYYSPSFLSLLPIPFVWGPVGGGESMPRTFWQTISSKAKLYEFLREQARRVGELDPFVHLTARRSKIAWATTEDTAKCLKRVGAKNVLILSQLGLNDREIANLTNYQTDRRSPVRFISIGRLLHWKGFHLGLQAFAQAELPAHAEYWIVGEGAELDSLQELVKKLDIAPQVKFWHKLYREETLQRLGECLALVHPSLHDSGGLVCLEAMAAGCPVICMDIGGPRILVTPETGFKVSAQNPDRTVKDLAKAMTRLSQDIELRNAMGKAGQERVRSVFSWKNKVENLDRIYQSLVEQDAITSSPVLTAGQQRERP